MAQKNSEFIIDEGKEYIELVDFLHVIGCAPTGGQCRLLIKEGIIKVNGAVEERVRKKLKRGDKVEYKDIKIVLK